MLIIYFYNISKDNKMLDFINTENVSFCISEIQEFIFNNLNLEICKKYDDLSFDKFNLNHIFDIMLFNSNYSEELNNTYDTFKSYYIQLIKIKEFLDLSIKEYEVKNNSNSSNKRF